MSRLRVVSFGLGPIGCEIARVASERANVEIIGAVDVAPNKVGRPLREVAGAGSDVVVSDSLEAALAGREADAVLHSTASSLSVVRDQLLDAARRGLNVVSTCEELSYPWRTQPGLARELHEAAVSAGARLLGTGVNPGFVMDAFPLVVTSACQRVDRISVERVVDAGGRRLPLQRKVGAGLSVEEFDELVSRGTVRHVGLPESAWMIVDAMGWRVDRFDEVIEPVIAEREISTAIGVVHAGGVAGVHQELRALSPDGAERLRMDLRMYVGAESPRDRVRVWGVPDLDVCVNGGIHGDRATAAMVLNSLDALGALEPGLLTMLDLLRVHSTGNG